MTLWLYIKTTWNYWSWDPKLGKGSWRRLDLKRTYSRWYLNTTFGILWVSYSYLVPPWYIEIRQPCSFKPPISLQDTRPVPLAPLLAPPWALPRAPVLELQPVPPRHAPAPPPQAPARRELPSWACPPEGAVCMASVLRETLPLDLSEPNGFLKGRVKRTLQQNVLMNNPYEANSTTY